MYLFIKHLESCSSEGKGEMIELVDKPRRFGVPTFCSLEMATWYRRRSVEYIACFVLKFRLMLAFRAHISSDGAATSRTKLGQDDSNLVRLRDQITYDSRPITAACRFPPVLVNAV